MSEKNKLAIIAGEGKIPALVAEEATRRGIEFFFVTTLPEIEIPENLKNHSQYIPSTKFGHILKSVNEFGAKEVIIIGKIPKKILYIGKLTDFDLKTLWLLRKLKNRNDLTIFGVIAEEFKKLGITVVSQRKYLERLIDFSGVLTKRKPNKVESQDIDYGLAYAREIAGLDIGQTVIVKRKAVLAVEAIEGTNKAILRAGEFTNGKGGVVCKVEKPLQDIRFDIPTVGMDTLINMKKSGCSLLALEEKKTFIIDKEDVVKFADENNISIIATNVSPLEKAGMFPK